MNTSPPPSLSVLHRQMEAQKRAEQNVHNLAKSMFQPGTKIEFKITLGADLARHYFGECVMVCGIAGTTRLRVRNLTTLKEREISLGQVIGLVREE